MARICVRCTSVAWDGSFAAPMRPGALPTWTACSGPAGAGRRILVVSFLPDDAAERQVLLHEMVHCSLHFAGFVDEHHGPHFIAELERLASLGEAWALEEAAWLREHREGTASSNRRGA